MKTATVKDLKTQLGNKTWRTTTARRCPTCKAPIVEGLDADRCAATVRVDPIPLTATGEALALLAGIPTYTAHRTNTRAIQLTRRSGRWPAIVRAAHDIWPAHRCGHVHTHTTATVIGRGQTEENEQAEALIPIEDRHDYSDHDDNEGE